MKRAWPWTGFDVTVAAALVLIAQVEVFLAPADKYPYAVVVPTALALAAPLLVRRSHPLICLALVLAAFVVQRLALGEIWDAGSSLAIPLVAVYSAAAYQSRWPAVCGYVAAVTVLSLCDIGDGGDVAFVALILGAIWIAGRMTRRQRELAEANAAYASELEAIQDIRAESAALEERARIARELHDVVAHCVSTMVVQAEAGQALVSRHPERAADSFAAIQSSGRQALGELRSMLGLLRSDRAGGEHGPVPSLRRLDELLDDVRAAGLHVDLTVTGQPRQVPQGLDLSAYRIVQESLTNTLKHADATRATVRIGWSETALDIEVCDDGRTADPAAASGSGHGLLGMRERAKLHRGELDSGPAPGGGYVVHTRLPLS